MEATFDATKLSIIDSARHALNLQTRVVENPTMSTPTYKVVDADSNTITVQVQMQLGSASRMISKTITFGKTLNEGILAALTDADVLVTDQNFVK